MGKHHIWRKNSNSYVRVDKNEPGCIWALFRVINYQRWSNVRKMLTYKKQKPHEKSTKNNKGKKDDEFEISEPVVLKGFDSIMLNSASVNSNTGTVLGKLLEEEDNLRKGNLVDQHVQFQEQDDSTELSTPTLLSLLKADPKLDSPRKRGLGRSGTFPSPNRVTNLGFGRTPSKVENKHTEIWPIISHGNEELRKAKSLRVRRSSSLNETLERFGDLFDAKISRKEVKKFPSLNEQEFGSLGDHSLLRKSFRERLSLLETESHTFGSIEAPRLSLEILNYMRGSRLDSPRDFDSPKRREKLAESQSDENMNENSCLDDRGQSNHQEEEQHIVEVPFVLGLGSSTQLQQDEVEDAESSVPEDLVPMSQSTPTLEKAENTQGSHDQSTFLEEVIEDYNEEYEYVKHVLDVLGFLGGEDQYQAWESIDETLNPTLFDEIEVLCPFKPKPSAKDSITTSSLDRKVMFHLIIEALVEIHEKSFMYYPPNSLSFCLQINTLSKYKGRVLEEVWDFVSKYLNWGADMDPRLDLLVADDMSRTSNDWQNNQTEIEFIGLDLEDLIFDELLEEILVDDC